VTPVQNPASPDRIIFALKPNQALPHIYDHNRETPADVLKLIVRDLAQSLQSQRVKRKCACHTLPNSGIASELRARYLEID